MSANIRAQKINFRFFRKDEETGELIPWIIEVDTNWVAQAEYKEADKPENPNSRAAVMGARPSRQTGRTSAHSRSLMAKWCVESVTPNPIPGSDALRAEFFEEYKALEEKAKAKGVPCPGCEKGKLQRRYVAKMQKEGLLKK